MDTAKFILMALVIIGHCLEKFTPQGACGSIYNTIYTFHMPLFIFITGYFTNTHKEWKAYFEGLASLLLTFLLFNIVWAVIHRTFSVSCLLFPAWTLWYLLSVAYWKSLMYLFKRVDGRLVLLGSVCIAIIGGFIPIAVLSIPRTLTFAPFFVLGYLAREQGVNFDKFRSVYILVPSLILFAVCLLGLKGDYTWLLYGTRDYSQFPCSIYLAPCLRLGCLILGCLFSLCLLAYCPSSDIMARRGENTMLYYLFHTFPIVALCVVFNHFGIEKSVGTFCVGLACVILFLAVCERMKIAQMLIHPYQTIKGVVK